MKGCKIIKFENVETLCSSVKTMCVKKEYDSGIQLICNNIGQFPHSPVPHNLLGILFEKKGNHAQAMKHFRAAWALDPAYEPASYNLHNFGTFYSTGKCAFDENDISHSKEKKPAVVCDANGVKHII